MIDLEKILGKREEGYQIETVHSLIPSNFIKIVDTLNTLGKKGYLQVVFGKEAIEVHADFYHPGDSGITRLLGIVIREDKTKVNTGQNNLYWIGFESNHSLSGKGTFSSKVSKQDIVDALKPYMC